MKVWRGAQRGAIGAAMRLLLASSFLAVACCPFAGDAGARRVITTPDAPAAIGPYSQGIAVGDTLWVAGQIGRDPQTGAIASESIESETRRALQNVGAVLAAAGFGFGDVVQAQVFLSDLADFERMNAIYATFFTGGAPPVRATVQAAGLPRNARIEVMVVAAKARR